MKVLVFLVLLLLLLLPLLVGWLVSLKRSDYPLVVFLRWLLLIDDVFIYFETKIIFMARLSQGILGGISGKIGNLVGSSWKGIPVIKTKPLSVANPRTSGQIAQRTKMSNVVFFAQSILASVIKPLWDRFSSQASGYNDFVSRNIALFADSFPSPWNSLVISKGKMTAVTPASVESGSAANKIDVIWPTTLPDSLSLATDLAYVVVIVPDQDLIGVSSGLTPRSVGVSSIEFAEAITAGATMYAYLAFKRVDGTVVTDTGYATDVY